MKKRLYFAIFISLFVIFGITSVLIISTLYINFYKNLEPLITVSVMVLILIILISKVLMDYLLKQTIKPAGEFVNYISKSMLDLPFDDKSEEEGKESLQIIKEYGHNPDQIQEGIDRLKRNQESRRNFSANVSHELKSPLTSINGYAELISTGMAKGEVAEDFAGRIYAEGNRLLKLIDETIEISKLDSNYVKNEKLSLFDISKMVVENINSLDQYARERKVDILFAYEKIEYFGNERLIFDMIRNLISNAIKYSSKNKKAYLIIKVEDRMDKVKISFEDNGIGIAKEELEKIFERFYTVDKSRANKSATGLGLSLVKNIVSFHKGEIKVESELGRGSTFIVTLPKLLEEDFV